MTPSIIRKPQVEDDLIHHYAFIAADKIEPAERLLQIAEESFQQLAAMPRMGTKWPSRHPALAGVYMYPLPAPYRNYLVFYRIIPQGIEILTVLHGAQNLERVLRRQLSNG